MSDKVMDTTGPVRWAVRRVADAVTPGPSMAVLDARIESAEQLRDEALRRYTEAAEKATGAAEALRAAVLDVLIATERETIACALADAAEGNRDRAAHCGECPAHPSGLCDGCAERLDRAESYDKMAGRLTLAVTS